MSNRTKLLFACFFAAAIVIIYAISRLDSSPPHDHSSSSLADPQQMEKESAHARLTLAIIYPFANPFYETITEQIEREAEPQSIRLIVKAPDELNSDQQIRMLESMIKQKVDGIAISPIDPVALAPHINKAVEQGIPVVCFEADVPNSKRLSFIGADPYKEGLLMGKMIDNRLNDAGMIMVESGLKTSLQQQHRLDGMLDYLKQNTTIKMLELRYNEGSKEQALIDLEGMISNHPHFDILVNMDFISTAASSLVWKAQGLNRMSVAFGMSPEATEALQNGQISAIISENEQNWGASVIKQLVKAAGGNFVSSWLDTGFQEITLAGLKDQL
ncbi:sugar ABC transporter substrate-binding protein [Paenibacillus kobensis]|uniref:sugar ABC transporter substrate-binding protein n=1 Tax=Paenibacillus kobensis TaxID=59841 RepID=UPI000FD8D5A4|nr:substrate-binding domain-containing protein [Paenibacillus kobensis]